MKTRKFEVIATYPYSPYRKGDIINENETIYASTINHFDVNEYVCTESKSPIVQFMHRIKITIDELIKHPDIYKEII